MFTIFLRRPQEDHVSRDALVLHCEKEEKVTVQAPPPDPRMGRRGASPTLLRLLQMAASVKDGDGDLFCFESEKSCTRLLLR